MLPFGMILRVRPLLTGGQSAQATETFLASLHPFPDSVTLSVASQGGRVSLLVECPDDLAPSAGAQLYAQHPDVEIEDIKAEEELPKRGVGRARWLWRLSWPFWPETAAAFRSRSGRSTATAART